MWRISQSLSIRQSSLQGPSRNAFSSSVSVMGGTARSFSQSGVPENSSASKPMVPALSASCSVAETLGRMPLILWKIGRVSAARRMAGTDSPASTITGSQASMPRGPTSTSYSPCSMPGLPDVGGGSQAQGPGPQGRLPHGKREGTRNANGYEHEFRHGVPLLRWGAPRALHQIKKFKALTLSKVDVYVNLRPTH